MKRLRHEYGHETTNWSIELHYHFRGYARRKPELDDFIADFRERNGIELKWVYVAKMLFGIFDM